MESAEAKYAEKRSEEVNIPFQEGLTKEETLAARGMQVLWSESPRVEKEIKESVVWDTLGKRKQTPKSGHKKK